MHQIQVASSAASVVQNSRVVGITRLIMHSEITTANKLSSKRGNVSFGSSLYCWPLCAERNERLFCCLWCRESDDEHWLLVLLLQTSRQLLTSHDAARTSLTRYEQADDEKKRNRAREPLSLYEHRVLIPYSMFINASSESLKQFLCSYSEMMQLYIEIIIRFAYNWRLNSLYYLHQGRIERSLKHFNSIYIHSNDNIALEHVLIMSPFNNNFEVFFYMCCITPLSQY